MPKISVKMPAFKCPYCGETWLMRVARPVACPRCHRVLPK